MKRTGIAGDQFAMLGSTYERFSGTPIRRFTGLRWESHWLTDDGVASHGADYWAPYLSRPHAAVLTGRTPVAHDE